MTKLKHWRDEGAPAEYSRLLRAARSEKPSSESVQRALVAAGIIGATSLAASSAAGATVGSLASAAGKGLFGLAGKWLVVTAVAGSVVATSVVAVNHHRAVATQSVGFPAKGVNQSPPKKAGVEPSPAEKVTVQLSPAASEAPMESLGSALIASREATPIPPSSAKAAIHDSSGGPEARGLLEEMALVDAARTSLRTGDAHRAAKSARHALAAYPSGQFAPESLFILMQSSQQLGQTEEANRAARQILARFPSSPQARKAHDLLQIP